MEDWGNTEALLSRHWIQVMQFLENLTFIHSQGTVNFYVLHVRLNLVLQERRAHLGLSLLLGKKNSTGRPCNFLV